LPEAARAAVTVVVTDPAGRPVSGLAGTVTAYRPSNSSLDQTLPVRETPAGSGRYRAEFVTAHAGYWRLTFALQRGSDRLLETVAWAAP
jgi:nitrogen fixation protein FixH